MTVSLVLVLGLGLVAGDSLREPAQDLVGDPMFLRKAYPTWDPEPSDTKGLDPPLLLSPLIREGRIEEARSLSQVQSSFFDNRTLSYSGYLTVEPKYNSNLFFWYFPAANGDEKAPLLLWLQGGPGASSLIGLFTEIGPYSTQENHTVTIKKYSWHQNQSLLFIDNPVGTGFSFTDDDDGYSTSTEEAAENLYKALIQFFTLFQEQQANPFYITGESYAGKYIPALGYQIHKNNPSSDIWINLKGMAIGNGFNDPPNQMGYSDFLFQFGAIDRLTKEKMAAREHLARVNMESRNYVRAYLDWSQALGLFISSAEHNNVYNILKEEEEDLEAFTKFVQRTEVRQALHVGDTAFTSIGMVYWKMLPDMMRSGRHWLEALIPHYRTMLYSGQFDVIVAYPFTSELATRLGGDAIETAPRRAWRVNGKLTGYVKRSGNLYDVMVKNAGHLVPADQPQSALHLIQDFIHDSL